MNGSITKLVINIKNKSVVDLNSVVKLSSTVIVKKEIESNLPKFREN